MGKKTETYDDQEWKWKWKTSRRVKQRAFASPPADEGSAGFTPEAGRVVPEQPENNLATVCVKKRKHIHKNILKNAHVNAVVLFSTHLRDYPMQSDSWASTWRKS